MTSVNGMQNRFSLSFTAASLRPELMRIAAEIFLSSDGWEAAKEHTLTTNAFQCRTTGSAIRLERELRNRLQHLTRPQLSLLAQAPAEDRAAMAWLAVCKHTGFVFEFASGVLREKMTSHDPVLRPSDYESYIELQAVSHPELDTLSPISKAKIRQVLFLMLGESGLLSPGAEIGRIQRPVLSPPVFDVIRCDDPDWLTCFLVPDNEITRL
jgi:hypothetical protein